MRQTKAEKGKEQEKAPNEKDGQPMSELAGHAAASPEDQPDAESTNILSATRSTSETMTDRFNNREASLVSLGDRVMEVDNASSSCRLILRHAPRDRIFKSLVCLRSSRMES